MQLNEQHIKQLYQFTRQHFVEHYDVQTELVDHLANDIEQIWQENSALTFEQARDKSFKKFGVFGFMDVVEKKQVQMQKKYIKTIFSFVKEWFKLPKVILTLFIMYAFFIVQKIPQAYYLFISLFLVIFTIELVVMFKKKRALNKKVKKTGKRWMFEEIIQTQCYGNIVFFSSYAFNFIAPTDFNQISFIAKLLVAIATTLIIIVGYISLYVLPKKSEELLTAHYPEYKIANQ